MATALGLSVDECLQRRTLRLTDFDDETVDNVIRQLKINKKSLLNKEIDYIKGLVVRTVQYNDSEHDDSKMQKFNTNSNTNGQNDTFFRYKEFNDIPDLNPNADLTPKWKGLTANLVMDIYGIFKAMKYGAFQRENYSKSHFIGDIKKAETQLPKENAVSSLVEEIDIESAVSFHPQYVIKDDLFETVNPLLAMSLVLNKLESEQIGNGIKIKCVVVPALITSIYDETKEFESNIETIADYLEQRCPWGSGICLQSKVSVITEDIEKTAQILQDMITLTINLCKNTNSTTNESTPSKSTAIFIVFNRRSYGITNPTMSVHVFTVSYSSAHILSDLDNNYFLGMDMELAPTARCWLRFGVNVRIRFVPEQLLWIIPSLFGRSSTMKPYRFWSRVYGDDYKHRWSVSLRDDILEKYHHILTGNILCSVNYRRDQITARRENENSVDGLRDHLEQISDVKLRQKIEALISGQWYDSDAVFEDLLVMEKKKQMVNHCDSNICNFFGGSKSKEFHRLKHDVIKYLRIQCDDDGKQSVSDCPLIEEVI